MIRLLPITLLLLGADIPTGGGAKWHLLSAKGDLYTRSATNDYALATAANGQCLITDSTTTTGLKWGSCSGSAGYTSVMDEGTPLTARATINFIGSAVTCVDNASRTECTVTASGAPTTSQYWTGASDVGLSAEKDLSALSTGLVVNTAGVPSTKGTNTCTNQFPRSDTASGVWTCASVADADLANAYSGIGACGANTWASTLSRNGAPTCTQPAFSNLSGSATDSQIPDNITINTATTAGTITGTLPLSQIATTNNSGDSTAFLRGDGVWAQQPTLTLTAVIAAKPNLLLPPCNPVRRFNCRSVKGFGQ